MDNRNTLNCLKYYTTQETTSTIIDWFNTFKLSWKLINIAENTVKDLTLKMCLIKTEINQIPCRH